MNMIFMMASIIHCYVGSNAGAPGGAALHVLECDTETGVAKIVQDVKGCEGTTYFQIDEAGTCLYSILSEKKNDRSIGSVVRFPLEGWRIGTMERLCELPCEAPCHVALMSDGARITFAAYLSATCGAVGIDGKGLSTYVFPDDAMGTNAKRQQKAYAHQTFHLPDGRVGVVDLGCDRIRFFDSKTMKPTQMPDIRFDSGDGPRHAIFSKDGKFLFVLCELGSSVYSFAFDGKAFSRIGKWSLLPEGYNRWNQDGETLNTKAAAVKLTADGKILMASNRGYDSIAFFAVGADGRLLLKNIAKIRGRFPRDFELMPGEKFMVVGHKLSDEIQVYRFDRSACTLDPVGAAIPCWRPLCFKFSPWEALNED